MNLEKFIKGFHIGQNLFLIFHKKDDRLCVKHIPE